MDAEIEIINEFIVERTVTGYRITANDGSDRHTHIKHHGYCNKLINYVVNKQIPKNTGNYILESCIRLSNDENYKNKVQQFLDVRRNKCKQHYYNKSSQRK